MLGEGARTLADADRYFEAYKKAILENIIDPSIIGGYILKIGDMQYDASIAHQLKSIKTRLTKTNSI